MIRVGVIFGGRSGEHEVSLRSAESVMRALDPAKYEVVPIGITHDGHWLAGEAMQMLEAGTGETTAVLFPPAPHSGALLAMNGRAETASTLDVVFPVLHGTYGEDGTIQGLLELADVPYVGAGVVGSAVGMDKAIFKQVMTANGLPILPWRLVQSHTWRKEPDRVLDALEAALPYPMFVKPANLGSSVGISKCQNRAELAAGLAEAAQYDRRLVVEQGAQVRELEVSVLGNEEPIASVVGEIRPRREFYDYVAKYVSDDSELLIPAPLDEATAEAIRALAVHVFQAVDCAGLARVDLMLDKVTGEVYVNEINTIPGFTSISMYPKLWQATGLSYSELLDKLIELAIERHDTKRQISFQLVS
ncbi:MAG: D-alanine--D-alanine ligase [Chloroflexi bacterium]|nr:D-alanine--D-alanine ligase [Chloroflexota bacterium]